jgi:hypothetical protein
MVPQLVISATEINRKKWLQLQHLKEPSEASTHLHPWRFETGSQDPANRDQEEWVNQQDADSEPKGPRGKEASKQEETGPTWRYCSRGVP